MNNSQFRRLVADSTLSQEGSGKSAGSNARATPSRGSATPSGALGSRMRSSIPMTPRSVTGIDFSRQLAEFRNDGQPPTKKFKSSAAPKGTKLASGYQDRTKLRGQDDEGSGEASAAGDKAKRIKALEDMVKLQQIDQTTFEKLRDEIGVGGDLESTHLIKGLDWKLLQKVREGQDIATAPTSSSNPPEEKVDLDEELDAVLEKDDEAVRPLAAEIVKKKGNMAPPPVTTGKQLSRDEILKQLKARRAAEGVQEAQKPSLGAKFRKIGGDNDNKKRWIEIDAHGLRREVLITADVDGKPKRKIRWLDGPPPANRPSAPDKEMEVLGMKVPAEIVAKSKASVEPHEEDDDIFAGVGTAYNPLGDDIDDSSESRSDEAEMASNGTARAITVDNVYQSQEDEDSRNPSAEKTFKPRNYFETSSKDQQETAAPSKAFAQDPTILEALKRAAALRQTTNADSTSSQGVDADSEAQVRHKKFLEEARKHEREDAIDMDMGFGESRFGDEEEEVYWDDGEEKKAGRKRGPKKKKGNKDSVSDVMSVLEGRKKGSRKE